MPSRGGFLIRTLVLLGPRPRFPPLCPYFLFFSGQILPRPDFWPDPPPPCHLSPLALKLTLAEAARLWFLPTDANFSSRRFTVRLCGGWIYLFPLFEGVRFLAKSYHLFPVNYPLRRLRFSPPPPSWPSLLTVKARAFLLPPFFLPTTRPRPVEPGRASAFFFFLISVSTSFSPNPSNRAGALNGRALFAAGVHSPGRGYLL